MLRTKFNQWKKDRQYKKWRKIDERNGKSSSLVYDKKLDHKGKSVVHFFTFNHKKTRPE